MSCLGADGSLGKATKCTALGKQSIVVSLTVSTAEGGKQVSRPASGELPDLQYYVDRLEMQTHTLKHLVSVGHQNMC